MDRPPLWPIPAVIVEQGETLSGIAERELGRAGLWALLAAANRISDPTAIRPGDILVTGVQAPVRQRWR